MFGENGPATFECEWCSYIKVIWANYGVQVSRQYPFAISSSDQSCLTKTVLSTVIQNECDGKSKCSLNYKKYEYLKGNCKSPAILLVRYTCKRRIILGSFKTHLFNQVVFICGCL